jgi:hypothetical protein
MDLRTPKAWQSLVFLAGTAALEFIVTVDQRLGR